VKSIWRALLVTSLLAVGQYALAGKPSAGGPAYFEAEVSLKLMTQLEDPSMQKKTGVEAIYIPKFPVIQAGTFCEAISAAKQTLMNKPYPGTLTATDGNPLTAPELDTTIDGLILKEVTSNTWIRSCLMGRKWHPMRRADVTCDEVAERECK
jgi:hypothetical protein